MKARFFLAVMFLICSLAQSKDKGNKLNKPEEASWIEANIILTDGDCGYLIQLTNGALLKPQTLPKKFKENHLKVWIRFSETSRLNADPCNASKAITITEIKRHRNTGINRSKY